MATGKVYFNELLGRNCLECPTQSPSCPECPSGQVCSMSTVSCDSCPYTTCVDSGTGPATSSTSSSSSSGGPEVGAIVGGVVGGLVVVAVITYFVWRRCVKNKRQQYQQEFWTEEADQPAEKDFTLRKDARASTHTVGSIASTVFTRASNVIQIAYIPGVTNRSAPSSPGLLVPPVPPIPIALSPASTTNGAYDHDHFFMPGDLRDSTYSGITNRASLAPSLAQTNRSSVASTIYGKNAVVSPVPAQTLIRGKAAVVSVKSTGSASPHDLTPPVPIINYEKYHSKPPPSPAFSVGSTFLNSASAATQVRPQVISVGNASAKSITSQKSLQRLDSRDRRGGSDAGTLVEDRDADGPFGDPPGGGSDQHSLSAMIEEATKRAHGDVRGGLGGKRESTPFGDEHEMNL